MEPHMTYLIIIAPTVPVERLQQFLETLEELRNMNRGGDDESSDTDRS